MASIKLDNLGRKKTSQTVTYKDVKLDLEEESVVTDNLYKDSTVTDIAASADEEAIKNSLANLFTTMPGQKLLDPEYGLNINQFLFMPLSEDIAEQIGEKIFNCISFYEPRVRVENVSVNVDDLNHQYDIYLSLHIPTLSNSTVTFKGILRQPGFSIS